MVSVVNGYVCFNCTDTEKAQKGVDPANPTNDPAQNKTTQTKKDEARAILKAEAAKSSRTASTDGLRSGQVSSGQKPPPPAPLPALLAPGIGELLDVTA